MFICYCTVSLGPDKFIKRSTQIIGYNENEQSRKKKMSVKKCQTCLLLCFRLMAVFRSNTDYYYGRIRFEIKWGRCDQFVCVSWWKHSSSFDRWLSDWMEWLVIALIIAVRFDWFLSEKLLIAQITLNAFNSMSIRRTSSALVAARDSEHASDGNTNYVYYVNT